jgi:hypothetical protein
MVSIGLPYKQERESSVLYIKKITPWAPSRYLSERVKRSIVLGKEHHTKFCTERAKLNPDLRNKD